MTSVERHGLDSYPVGPLQSSALAHRPSYSALSYTWGRFETGDKNAARLRVHGIDWPVPAVHQTHFTVSSFEKALRYLGTKHQYAWVDIACIHQTDDAIKMKEITEQGKIFRQASSTFIWLTEMASDTLQVISKALERSYDEWYVASAKQDQETYYRDYLDRAVHSMNVLIKDPYFASLWTLQESQICRDAMFLSADAGFACGNFLLEVSRFEGNLGATYPETGDIIERVDRLVKMGRRVGYNNDIGRFNPNTSFAAASHRTASLVQDRIYGTMSMYDMTVRSGSEIQNAPYAAAFDDLEHAFAAAVNTDNPAIGQCFIHTAEPRPGESWKLTQRSRSWSVLQLCGAQLWDPHPRCSISATERGCAMFRGDTCALKDAMAKVSWGIRVDLDEYLLVQYAALSGVVKTYGHQGTRFDWAPREMPSTSSHLLAETLMEIFGGDRVSVLRLNDGRQSLGVLLLREEGSVSRYKRIGVCIMPTEQSLAWTYGTGELH